MKESFRFAFLKTIPVMLGYLFLGLAFGLLLQEAGYSFWWALLISAIVYAGSIQFVLVSFLTAGTSLPVVAVMAAFAEGTTIIRDAAELKVKESNRIDVMVENLSRMGTEIEATDDGMIIRGGRPLHGATIDPHLDHRIAMSFAVAALASEGDTKIKDADCVRISYPEFYEDLLSLQR